MTGDFGIGETVKELVEKQKLALNEYDTLIEKIEDPKQKEFLKKSMKLILENKLDKKEFLNKIKTFQ